MVKNNASPKKITQADENNDSITINFNVLQRGPREFLRRALRINKEEQRPWCYVDFPNLSRGNFRQYILKVKPFIEVVIPGKPTFYKIKGISLPGDSRRITLNPMGGEQFFTILDSLKFKDSCIHDITIKINNSVLHRKLLLSGKAPDKTNDSFLLPPPKIDNNITTKILVYSETILLHLGCTYRPLIYDSATIWHLHEYLSKISYWLHVVLEVLLPPVHEWICTHYHFGKDGSQKLSGQSFNFEFNEVTNGLIRFYSKKMLDGTIIPRLEAAITPNRNIEDEMKKTLFNTDTNLDSKYYF